MGDPVKMNCAAEICCEPEGGGLTASTAQSASRKAVRSLAGIISEYAPTVPDDHALAAAEAVLTVFELAPRGTLSAFKRAVVELHKAGTPE